ncbi:hypothetical protein Csa_008880 [Cucumis sativus]|uniref:Prolamin-like domain-containing protein n=1 Tax=Cucumis sativus TaxID=3659 RepID=A0A0A0KQ41_CUCSA|nr:hypothetical protein Csa_008880 [Cucumis sativus]
MNNSTRVLLVVVMLSLLVVDSLALVQPSTVDDNGISSIWSDWLDEDRAPTLAPCLHMMRSEKCQVELYNYYFNISKKELDLSCCVYVNYMGKKCAAAFEFWFSFPSLEALKPNPMKVYNNCFKRLTFPAPTPL